jgi:hypothetical protein
MAAEAEEIARAGAAGIDKGGGAAALCYQRGIDAERGAAPIDMCMQVDQSRRDDQTARIDDRGAFAWQVLPDGGDLAIGKGDVSAPVASVRRLDVPACHQDEARHCPAPSYRRDGPTRGRCGAKAARCARRGWAFPQRPDVMAASPKATIDPSPRMPVQSAGLILWARRSPHQHIDE